MNRRGFFRKLGGAVAGLYLGAGVRWVEPAAPSMDTFTWEWSEADRTGFFHMLTVTDQDGDTRHFVNVPGTRTWEPLP